ncbi:MAG: acyl-ACP--UDP-N-acetylglucosamine O-acyltransferase [Marinosulfonomonas sp.]|nr:acyl-ACP--UDP-N-acetylglucosamine O-acyltransferase [Marinosulfonomonas sp.]
MTIHPTADIHASAVLEEGCAIGEGCVIGPFCCVGPNVVLGPKVHLKSHVVVTGHTELGEDSVVFSFATVGGIPQDLKFMGEETRLIIGKRACIREGATLNTGTDGGGGLTQVGDDCLIMTGAHVAHDAILGNNVILANQVAVAGHCVIGDDVIIGGLSGIHQFVRIGRGAIIGAVTMVTNDVIPFGLVQSARGELDGLNLIGLKRRGVARDEITALRAAYQSLAQGDGAFQERAGRLADESDSSYVQEIADFILGTSGRSFLTPK